MNRSLLRRLRVFSGLVVLLAVLLTARLAWLQIYNFEYYRASAEDNRQRQLPIAAPRGEIFALNGELLAGNRPGFAVSLLDFDLRDTETVRYLAELLEMDEEYIRERVRGERFRSFAPIQIASNVSPEVVAKLEERRLDLPGVIIETQLVREYVNGSQAAHVLGYVGPISRRQLEEMQAQGIIYRGTDAFGQEGVEHVWEQTLRGQEGTLLVEKNRFGRRTRILAKEDPVPGNNIYLTLDARLQAIAEQALRQVIENLAESGNTQSGRGSVVILDPRSGAIRAMVSYPAYDPNTLAQNFKELAADRRNQPLRNKAIQDFHPVGSTFKMLPGIAALQEGLINEQSRVTCRGVATFFNGRQTSRCLKVHGALSIIPAIAQSCNVFFYEMGYRLGIDRLSSYAESFGFGSPTGLNDLRGEAAGSLNSRARLDFMPGNLMGASIGQGHEITALQMANFAAMLANGGIHYRPYLVQKAQNHLGEVIFNAEPEIMRQLEFSKENWEIIRQGMKDVTDFGGTAPSMRRLPVKVAGKTGTVEVSSLRYSHSTFVGYAPAEAPELAFYVIVENALHRPGSSAVPVISQIIGEYYSPIQGGQGDR
ncbi:MAG: penicillin-binding protein 2 [Dethiobacter sp.]|jgi:penicillin-binding protein 2|nr:penicillin-binding protein 2 [Dethiobacter sp.]MBS3901179.1 penicillin-binding protein 2 [Dethiobacter sp.]MBS3989129.1 penicillin-binding protein 2 [Dethiobacter sp.]